MKYTSLYITSSNNFGKLLGKFKFSKILFYFDLVFYLWNPTLKK